VETGTSRPIVAGTQPIIPYPAHAFNVAASNGALNSYTDERKELQRNMPSFGSAGCLQFADIVLKEDCNAACSTV